MSSLEGALISPPSTLVAIQPEYSNSVMSDHAHMERSKSAVEVDPGMEDLFGNDEDIEAAKADGSATSPGPSGEASDRVSTPEREHRRALEYDEEDEPGGVVLEAQEVSLELPNIPMPKSSDGNTWVIRMPNFIKLDTKPFHPETYLGPEHEDEEAHQATMLREKSMTVKLKVENTVRWRWVKDENGQDRRQSNSRIIRWSDGSLSLRLGKELFDINQSIDTSGAIPRTAFGSQPPQHSQADALPSQFSSQSQSQSQGSRIKSQGLTYLVAQHKRCQVLQSEALITGHMTLTPTDMQSETHRMLVRAVGQKHNKVARLRMAPDPTTDPEREKMELMKQSAKKSKKKAEFDDGLGGGRRKRAPHSRRRGHDVWSDDDDGGRQGYAASDEEDDDEVDSGGASPRKGKRKMPEGERKGVGEYEKDGFLVADSDDDAGSEGGGGKRQRRDKDVDMEEDPLDKLDAKILEQEVQQKRRARRPAATAGDNNPETEGNESNGMDVESEEDEEEEFKVRLAGGTGGKKKRAIQFDDEDE